MKGPKAASRTELVGSSTPLRPIALLCHALLRMNSPAGRDVIAGPRHSQSRIYVAVALSLVCESGVEPQLIHLCFGSVLFSLLVLVLGLIWFPSGLILSREGVEAQGVRPQR